MNLPAGRSARRLRGALAAWVGLLAVLVSPGAAPAAAAPPQFRAQIATSSGPALRVGSKRFTESYILGEALQQQAVRHGPAVHRAGLGNTAILLAALASGEIDVYPEYTGTIAREILGREDLDTLPALAAALRARGLGVAVPLGFSDAYALAMPANLAHKVGIVSIGDLATHPGLRLALSQEFLNRRDGWPALAAHYGLGALSPSGMDHGLAYRALAAGAVDVIDAYTTDAQLARAQLVLLSDPDHVIPPYEAVLLYRLGTPERFPAQWQALQELQGRVSEVAMRTANALVDLDHQSFAVAAQSLLPAGTAGTSEATADALPPAPARLPPAPREAWQRFADDMSNGEFAALTLQHLSLVFGPVTLAVLCGLPLGVLAASRPALAGPVLGVVGILQTVPALALLALLIAATGRIGMLPALLALFIYALLPIISAAQAGLAGIDRNLREAAVALGAPWAARVWHIELPAARGTLLAGIRTAAVINVGGATLAAFVGAGGYGERIVAGLAVNDPVLMLAGAIPSAALALLIQAAFGWFERRIDP